VVDIDDVTPQSKLSGLTVEQFVQLLTQTWTQIMPSGSLRRQRREGAIAELIDVLKSDSEPVNAIKKSFAEIGRTLPQVLLEVARRIREAQAREAQAREAQARGTQAEDAQARSTRRAEPNGPQRGSSDA
jgi:hypothetical protein